MNNRLTVNREREKREDRVAARGISRPVEVRRAPCLIRGNYLASSGLSEQQATRGVNGRLNKFYKLPQLTPRRPVSAC